MALMLSQHQTLLESDLETPVGLFIRLVGEQQGIFLESAEIDGRWGRSSIIATDFLFVASCNKGVLDLQVRDERLAYLKTHEGKPFIDGLREIMQSITIIEDSALPPITRALYGYFNYEAVAMFEPALSCTFDTADAEADFALPGSLIYFDHSYNTITRIHFSIDGVALVPLAPQAVPKKTPVQALENTFDIKKAYVAAVSRVKEYISQGKVYRVALSTSFSALLKESPFAIYRRLRKAVPSPYMFYMRFPHTTILGSSPEVMVTCSANKLRLCPIAGTSPKGKYLDDDAFFNDESLHSVKEQAEHSMLVDLGQSDLNRIAVTGSVQLERFMEVEHLSHMTRVASRINAYLAPQYDALDVLQATFPAGSVSGLPKINALQIIHEQEKLPRGPYAGAMGWMGLDKESINLDFGIMIRSLWVKDGHVHWQAGAGVTHDSVADDLWDECSTKAAIIRNAVLGVDATGNITSN